MIYNGRYIIPGVLLLAGVITMPLLLNLGKQYTRVKPVPPPTAVGEACIEPRAYMAASHMEMLSAWRDAATRENKRVYIASDGKEWPISLTGTCMSCHKNKAAFCDACHTTVGVSPYCWDCHALPEEP